MGHHPFCCRGLTIGSTVFGPNFLHSRNEPLSTFSTITVPVTLSLSPRRRGQLAGVVAPVFDPIKDGFNDYSSRKKLWASIHEPCQIKGNSHSPTASFRGATASDLVR
ncbi:hypothetical protein FF1_039133 [Malus domestica]